MPVGPVPGPVGPGPDNPPVFDGGITLEQFDAIGDETPGADGVPRVGTSEADVLKALGKPLLQSTAAGYHRLIYAIKGSESIAWFFVGANGKVARKSKR